MLPAPPRARKEPKRIDQLGRFRIDEYAWLKDENWQAVMRDPSKLRADIRAHLEAENAYTKAVLASTEALQEALFQDMKGRMKEDDWTVPAPDGPWEYYIRYEPGAQHPRHVRRPRGAEGPEELLLDIDAQAKGRDYYEVAHAAHSHDHAHYVYAVDTQGSEFHEVRVRDLATGADLPSPATNSTGDFAISPDSQFLFWIYRDEHGRPRRVYRRPLRGGADVLVYEEQNEGFFISVSLSESRAFLLIGSADHETSETRFIPMQTPSDAPVLFQRAETGVIYDLTHWDDRWLIRTNADGAIDFKVMACPLGQTGREHWRDVVPHEAGRYIVSLGAARDYLVRLERMDALPRIVIRDKAGREHAIAQDEEAYSLGLDAGAEYDSTILRYVYNSPTTPKQWFDYDMAARTRTLRKTQEIPSGHNPADYICRRFSATAPDGAQAPVTLLMRRDAQQDGAAPVLLYGYGAYGMSMHADFSERRFALVDRGWIWAIAHVRGGSERGYGWFLDGRREKKPNTFSDFIAVADDLIARGLARAGNIVAYGGSAGGMLMGAVANMRPELWAGVIGAVPFVDVLNTMSDASLPLTPPEWPEWGNPIEDPAAYDLIASYSPYDNIKPQPYPAILATGGLSDPRVTYWEPAKWVAKLRDNTTSARPVLLKLNMEAGHGGASGRFDYLRDIAVEYAFAMKAVGAAEAGGGF